MVVRDATSLGLLADTVYCMFRLDTAVGTSSLATGRFTKCALTFLLVQYNMYCTMIAVLRARRFQAHLDPEDVVRGCRPPQGAGPATPVRKLQAHLALFRERDCLVCRLTAGITHVPAQSQHGSCAAATHACAPDARLRSSLRLHLVCVDACHFALQATPAQAARAAAG